MKNLKELLLNGDFVPRVNEVLHKESVGDCTRLRNILSPIIQQHPTVEKFYSLYLDAKNGLLLLEPSFTGSISGCSVYPREIIKKALEVGAAALIVAHNHPSGNLDPSPEDLLVTKRIHNAALLFGITLHDHLIVNPTDYYSFSEKGLISQINEEWVKFENRIKWNK